MRHDFTKYNQVTGQIEYIFTGADGDEECNQPCIRGRYDAREYKIVNGMPVKKPQSEIDSEELIEAEQLLRLMRNAKLRASDWTQAADAPVDRAAWAAYRQALRDLPANTADPRDPQWPSPPA